MLKIFPGKAAAIVSFVMLLMPALAHSGPYTQTFVQIQGGAVRYVGSDPTPFRCSVGGPDGSTSGTLFPLAGASKADGNADCSIGGTQRLQTDLSPGTDLLVDSALHSARFSGANFDAGANARSASGLVGASASVGFDAGFTNNQMVHDALAFAAFGESLTIGGASGGGWAVFSFDIDGTLVGRAAAAMEAVYRSTYLGGSSFRLVSGSAGSNYNGQGLFDPATSQRAPGFGVSSASGVTVVSGRQTFQTALVPFLFGQAFDFELGMIVGASEWDGQSEAQFFSTARLSGIKVFTRAGVLQDPTFDTASGATWTTQGLQDPVQPPTGVPVPATATLLLAALAGAGLARCRIRRAAKSA